MPQTYQNHRKIKPETPFHKLYYALVVGLTVMATGNLCIAIYRASGRFNAFMFLIIALSLATAYFLFRPFALKAQDRAIRAEENLRYFAMVGKLLPPTLTISQIIALRFAPDEEFLGLVERAVKENLSNNDIKKAIVNWKEDNHRA